MWITFSNFSTRFREKLLKGLVRCLWKLFIQVYGWKKGKGERLVRRLKRSGLDREGYKGVE